MTMTEIDGLPLLKAFKSDVFPLDRLDPHSGLGELLARIIVTDYEEDLLPAGPDGGEGGRWRVGLSVAEEAVINLVGLEGFALVFGGDAATLQLGAEIRTDGFKLLIGAGARLRFPRHVLKPVRRDGPGDPWVDDEARNFAELEINAGITIDDHFDVEFDGSNAFVLEPAMIADSGLVIEGEVALDLSESSSLPESTALGLGPEWQGIVFKDLTVHLPEAVTEAIPVTSLSFENFHIGSGGVTGTVSLDNDSAPGEGALGGFPFVPTGLSVELRQNCLVQAELTGRLTLSFFDEPLDVTAGFDLDGNFTVAVSAESGLVELTKPDILSLELDGVGFALEEGVFSVSVSGTLTPLIGGLDWPGFRVDELSIDSQGHVRLEGGWLNLPAQFGLDFYGFHVAITRLGMGSTDDGGKWIGFSGSVKLVDGLSIGGSVDGLRVTWYDDGRAPHLTCDGVGVELEIPDVLRFKGAVSFHTIVTDDGHEQKRFDGEILLDLMVVGLRIDGQIVIGTDTGANGESYTFFALYIGVELPAGIPLGCTGLGLFGMAGLVAIQMAPNKGATANALHPDSRPDESWFENDDGSPGWFKRDPIGIVALKSKWDPVKDGFALGAGVTLGTVSDNGYMFSAKVLLVLSFPGPVILIEGKANLAKERASLSDDPLFRLLVVLDFRSGDLLAGLMAKYAYDDEGSLIEIAGSAEAYFNYNDPSRWHVYAGVKDPKTRRIRANILSIFEANTYLMIDAESFQTGAWIGWDKRWDFGPVGIVLEVWIEGGAQLSWKPPHFYGYLWLHGNVSLKVFGFGVGLYVDAKVSADVFDPFEVVAELHAGIDLPWPLPDFEVDLTVKWGPEPGVPPLALALKEVAVEHFKATASWPLARGELMQPAVDAGDGFLADPVPVPDLAAPPPANAPVVPVDARPHLTFGRSVHDDALIGVNPQPVLAAAVPAGYERIGDPGANQGPMRVRYGLKEVVLSRWTGASWVDVARKGPGANAAGVVELYGSWAPVPALPSGSVAPGTDPPVDQTKLWLWSRSPFDYTRHGNRTWDEWFTQRYQQYPCIPPVQERTVCCDADGLQAGGVAVLPMSFPAHPEVVVTGPGSAVVRGLDQPVGRHGKALRWDPSAPSAGPGTALSVLLTGPPASRVRVLLSPEPRRIERHCFDAGDLVEDNLKLPVELGGFGLRVFDFGGGERSATAVRPLPRGPKDERGIDIGYGASVSLPCPADSVEVTLWQSAGPVEVVLLDADGKPVGGEKSPGDKGLVTVVVRGGGAAVTAVINAPQNETLLVELCVTCGHAVPLVVDVTGIDDDGKQHGPFPLVDGTATVAADRLRSVEMRSVEPVNLVEACVTYPPSDDELVERTAMARHLVDSTARWSDTGEVLLPNTAYRLRTVTTIHAVGEGPLDHIDLHLDVAEVAWFRTQGPPALAQLSTPAHQPPGEAFASGLDDLTRYVRQTVPATVPARGEQPLLPRPVFRADDVGVEFNEDYVDLMYRLARRDLRLQLVDANDQPVRDLGGRVVVADNRWGTTETLTLSESEQRFLSMIDRVACVSVDQAGIPRSGTLTAVHPDLVLAADAVHQARLVPMLLHEDFRGGFAGWPVVDVGTIGAPSRWVAENNGALQTSSIRGNEPAGAIGLPGTLLVGGDSTWTDLRATVALRTSTVAGSNGGSIGLAFRYQGPGNCYRFSMDRAAGRRRLVRFVGGVATLLAEDQVTMALDHDHEVTVELVGPAVRVSIDGAPIFDVTDPSGAPAVRDADGAVTTAAGPLAAGRLTLYCSANPTARFSDVRVDDLRSDAPVAYRFSFTTSRFVDIHHLLHSFEDGVWATPSPLAAPAWAAPLAAAVDLAAVTPASALAAVGDAEARAFTTLAGGVLGAAARNLPAQLDVHRVTLGGVPLGLLIRSPEPLDWSRTTVAVSRAAGLVPEGTRPGPVKLIGLAPGGDTADDEVVSLITRSRLDLAGLAIETYGIPDPWPSTGGDELLLDGDTADWSDDSDADGTPVAIAGEPDWADVVVTAAVRPAAGDPSGLLVRYESNDDFVRFSIDPSAAGRHLVRCQGGTLTTLWEDAVPVVPGHTYEMVVATVGPSIRVWLNGVLLLEVDDHGGPATGQVGLYGPQDADRFSAVGVHDASPLPDSDLFVDNFDFAVPGRWTVETAGDQSGPAVWTVVGGELRQTSEVWGDVVPSDPAHPAKPGTMAVCTEPDRLGPLGIVAGSAAWADLRVTVRLRSDDDDAIGVVFRYVDADNWYRFSMDHWRSYRRLVRCVGGVVDELWSDAVAYEVDREHLVTIDAVGDALTGWVDGVEVFSVRDSSHPAGTVGLYCWANAGARFASVRVTGAGWSTHHVFPASATTSAPATAPAGAGLVEAGTRVELHSGAAPGGGAAAAPPPVPGLVHRYVATGGAQAHRRLPTHRPVDVRLSDTVTGEAGHARRFLPAAAYAPAGPLRVLRKADGTEAFLFQPATGSPGATLAAGQLRLQVTYRRDNTAAVPGSQVRSRAGHTGDEHVTLDIPWTGTETAT
jgi:hypothetical protein